MLLRDVYLVRYTLPHPATCIHGGFESLLASSPVVFLLTFFGRGLEPYTGVLLLRRCYTGHFRYRWPFNVRRCFVFLMRLKDFLNTDTLELGFSLRFFAFNLFMVSKVFEVLRVVIRFVSLSLWC